MIIERTTFDFLAQLKANNNRAWFEENKSVYLSSKQNVLNFVTELLAQMSQFDPEFEKLDPQKTLFRIYRDVRFSADKSPYKTNFGASINGIGKKGGGAGYYLHIEPGLSFLASGVYMADAARMKEIRSEISENAVEFSKIIHHQNFKKFELNTEKMARVPQGFSKDDRMAEYLKMKHFLVSAPLKDEFFQQSDSVEKCTSTLGQMKPFVDFLNACSKS